MLAMLMLATAPVALPDDGWVALEQPLIEGAAEVGCNAGGTVSLDDGDGTWMVADGIRRSERFTIYVELEDGRPRTVRAFTPDCDIRDADRATPVDIAPADAVALIEGWLDDGQSRETGSRLVASVAHIDHASVNDVLEREAEDTAREDAAQDALFWLANRRGDTGRDIVVEHLDERWPLTHRKQAVMALALSKRDAAWEHVRDMARNGDDVDLRAHAVTALAISDAPGALADLHSIFMTETAEAVRRQAIFGLAQLDSREAAAVLIDIARDARHGELRRDALFWLANMDDKFSGEFVDDLVETAF